MAVRFVRVRLGELRALAEVCEDAKAVAYRIMRDALGDAPRQRLGDDALMVERLVGEVVRGAHQLLQSAIADGEQQRLRFAP